MIASRKVSISIQGACDFSYAYGQYAYQQQNLLFQYFLNYKNGEPSHFIRFGLDEKSSLFPFEVDAPPIRTIGRRPGNSSSDSDWCIPYSGRIEPISIELTREEDGKSQARQGLNLTVTFGMWSIKAILEMPWGNIEVDLPDHFGRRRPGVSPVKAQWVYKPSLQEFSDVGALRSYLHHMLRPK